jgi:exodeoxyribonuclease V gamma subunit
MVRLVYSNRTEELLAELAARVRAQQARDGALVLVQVVVPNTSVEAYVRQGVAREAGIAANLDTSLLTRFVGDVASPPDARVADAETLESMALALLLDEALLDEPDLAPVRAYLHAAGEAPDAVDVRRVQLAVRLGRIFEEYTYSRAEMLASWRRGVTLEGKHADTERWQRRLWLGMFGEGGLAGARTPRIVPLDEAVDTLEPRRGEASRTLHVFGFAHVARTFHRLFERLGRTDEIVVYALTPCEGLWEDVETRDPAPLALWGRAGREHVRALNVIASFDHDDRFVDPLADLREAVACDSHALAGAPPTLLRRLQHDILRREHSPPAPLDDSLRVLEHASIRRECEAIASAVWALLKDDETLRFDDVAVLVPPGDAAAYAAHLPAAFREAHDLPHRIVGLPPVEPTPILEALELLLALPLGRFTRGELLRLAVHPAVVAGHPGVDPERWLAWSESLGILHGADRSDHAGTYIDRDILNWDQGLRRLALGAFMTGETSGEATPFCIGDDAYLPHEVAGSDVHDAASFGLLVQSLIADARFALAQRMTTRHWATFLRTLVETYVVPSSDAETDELSRCLRRLGSLADVDLGDRPVGYRVACELARARLAAGVGAGGGEGVVVSTIAAARPLPFRAVFACGMGEGHFPSPDVDDPLDLRWAARQPADVTARDRDKFAFLELLLGARDRLVLSYVSRDPLTGDELAPASVVQDLMHALAGRTTGDVAELRRRHPLRRWDPAYFPELFGQEPGPVGTLALPEARAEAQTLALRRSLERDGRELTVSEIVERSDAGEAPWVALSRHLRLAPLPVLPPVSDARVFVTESMLVKFLEMPLQGWARFRLGLEEREDEDVLAREAEPFETDPRRETTFLRDILLTAVQRGVPVEQAYDDLVHGRALRGQGPSGLFAEGERVDHMRVLTDWRKALAADDVPPDTLALHRFGRAGELSHADVVHPPLVIDVDYVDPAGIKRLVKASITGRMFPLGPDAAVTVTLAKRANEGEREWAAADRKRVTVRAFVDHAILTAAGVRAGDKHRSLHVLTIPGKGGVYREELAPLGRDEATTWLRDRIRELLAESHAYFLPCEAIFKNAADDSRGPLVPVLEEARDLLRRGDGPLPLRSAYGPVPRPQEYRIPGEAEAQAMVARRFALLLETRETAP